MYITLISCTLFRNMTVHFWQLHKCYVVYFGMMPIISLPLLGYYKPQVILMVTIMNVALEKKYKYGTHGTHKSN